ncbi:type III polyketide synthase [Pseudochryseolinea flava]|uniref:Type III polyketide synthase n=1 Tax=Pseudochryseolinea flava TaxID=2059302 RepID=A0A364Y9T9_9BACT|nr:type III polyketide synthase [Pseudochryseolinea flava]RAW03205.1 type III polyketide synthase [Pseudochryseolinea flava]
MSYITAIGKANPSIRISQSDLADFMIQAMQPDAATARILRTVFKASGIDYRHTVIEDYAKKKDYTFFPNTPNIEPFPSTEQRMKIFYEHALPLSVAAVKNMVVNNPSYDRKSITHLIVVCCTGMYAPGLDIELVEQLELPTTVQRTSITFMGCYAAFNALKVADAFCAKDENAKVLIVCTELCSLHFQKSISEDNLLANALFADGSAAVLVEAQSDTKVKLKLEAFYNDLAREGANDMAWHIGNVGFEMKLSTYVPDIIKKGIGELTDKLLRKIQMRIEDIRYYAIHPGGKKILTAIEEALLIGPGQNFAAYHTLRNYGNMSSPTVLFVLREIFDKLQQDDHDKHILSFAFGPGLTLESMLLQIKMR